MTSPSSVPNGWLPLEDALRRTLSQVCPVAETDAVIVNDALHRVVSEDVVAVMNVPPADNSAMDGFALYASDSQSAEPLTVVATQLAGMPLREEKLKKGQAVRIMTGALVPTGADCVVMQENTTRTDEQVEINKAAMPGENIRRAGGDIASGTTVIQAGTQLTASHLVLLASMGIASVNVYRKLRVGIIATGDELKPAGETLVSGQIYESNRTGTRALLAAEPVIITDYGIVADDKAALSDVFSKAAKEQDLVISSGGVSVGDADFVKELVASQGDIAFWKIAIKPGKPFAFGSLGDAVFCGVPGNPVSAFVTTQQLVLPVIKRLTGVASESAVTPLTFKATLTSPVRRRPGRQEFLRARMHKNEQGDYEVEPLAKQSSGVMTTVTQANCYIIVPAECSEIIVGNSVTIQPFSLLEIH